MTPFNQYELLLKEAEPIAVKYVEDAEGRIQDLYGRLRNDRVRVMLFGAYNAGKSTLINALLGREAARVGDVPTTDEVSEYEWDGHLLFDTPGVNAPIAHEEVSLTELERTDIILFVLRQEDQDSGDVMRRVFDLLEAGRPIFLLLNYDDADPSKLSDVRSSLNRTLIRYAEMRNYDLKKLSTVPVMMLNARTAFKSRLMGKEKLREHSGYDDFMLRFTEWLRKNDEENQVLKIKRCCIASKTDPL